MAIKAGVWIDHKQAVVVLVTDAGQKLRKFKSTVDKLGRPTRASQLKHRYTPKDFVAEDKLQRKDVSHRNRYYDEVIEAIQGADTILILGPGEAKGEFSKRINGKKVRGRLVELETTDKMTDRQIAAKVGQHFSNSAVKTSAAPKKKTKAIAGKQTKKSGK